MEKVIVKHFKERLQKGEYVRKREAKLLPKDLAGKLLEVGCGARFTYSSEKMEMYGIDITPEMIKFLKRSHSKAYAIIGNVKKLPFKRGVFDVIVSNVLLHHLIGKSPQECKRNIKNAIREMRYVLKPQGTLLIRELVARNYLFSLTMFYTTILCAKFGIEIDLLDIHSKVITFFLTEKDLKKILLENGFKMKKLLSKDFKIKKIKIGEENEFLITKTN